MNTAPTDDPAILETWIGRTQELGETIDVTTMNRLAMTLGLEPTVRAGDPIAPLWHFATFIEAVPAGRLGHDGHPRRGGFLPPVALPRRMWAGSRITFGAPILAGVAATKHSTIESVVLKNGSSGPLCFVTVHHVTSVDGEICIDEEQDIVYRDDPDPDTPPRSAPPAPTDAELSRTIVPDPTLLFRYSAATFNGHRIHYDRDYASSSEGYAGLVVHGPLTATLLAQLATEHGETLTSFSFRGVSPLLDTAPFTIHRRASDTGADLWATSPTGGLAMTAQATYR
ncbi:MAG: FAS1-like dehydratase domain-containing protein [Acidimicrobiales bacterium]